LSNKLFFNNDETSIKRKQQVPHYTNGFTSVDYSTEIKNNKSLKSLYLQKCCLLLGLASVVTSTAMEKQQPNSIFNLPEDTRHKHSPSFHGLQEANRASKLNSPYFDPPTAREKPNVSPSFRQSEAVREKPLAAPSAFKPAEAAGDGSNSSGLERDAQDGLERFAQSSLFKI
jgi:hypothetical protein